MPLQGANPTPSFGGFGLRMTRWSLFLQTPSSSYTTPWDSTVMDDVSNGICSLRHTGV